MTMYTCVCTVEPLVPAALVNAVELELFEAFGFVWECTQDRYYFYSRDFSESGSLAIDEPRDFARALEDEYPDEACRPTWVRTLGTWLDEHLEDGDSLWLEPGQIGIDVTDVLAGVLNKPANLATVDPITEFVIDGAYTASRLVPSSHGGWSVRVGRDGVFFLSTHRHGEYLNQARRLAQSLATAKANSGHVTPVMREADQLLELLGVPVS